MLFAVTLACYWQPLMSDDTSILWDAADQFQPFQNYVSEQLREGRIPFWTPYLAAGYPLLADPQVGAWYPPNWPFFLVGVTPRMLVGEHFLHALLACLGAYVLAQRCFRLPEAAVLAGLSYGLGGFFVGHSSHTPMLQAAAWLPWLLLLLDRALESRPVRNTALGGLVAGMIILAGHFQTALYSFMALALFALARTLIIRGSYLRAATVVVCMPLIGTALSAVATAPGLELTLHSVRTSVNALTRTEGILPLPALATLVAPNHYGLLSGLAGYRGPSDVTQFYFYAGFALVPLALLGLSKPGLRLTALMLCMPTVWYAMGHSAGLYSLMARLPGFSSVRAPINIWFVPALGLALLAGAGLGVIALRWRLRWVALAIVAATAADLFWRNSAANPLAYARTSYDEAYGGRQDDFRWLVAAKLPPLARFDAPPMEPSFGPLNHPLEARVETTYSYTPLALLRFQEYVEGMRSNPRLRDGLNVTLWLDASTRTLRANPTALSRATFPQQLVRAASYEEARARLRSLDPARQALVPADVRIDNQDGRGRVEVRAFEPGYYKLHYQCESASLLRVSTAWFPGWSAKLDGRALDVVPVDHALIGIVVPAGEGDVELAYGSTYFVAGATTSVISLLFCLVLVILPGRTRSPSPNPSGTLPP